MRFPQVSDRVKEAPAQALRGLFAGIGQLLLFTDKLKNKDKAAPAQQLPPPRAPRALEGAGPAAVAAPPAATVTPSPAPDAPVAQKPAAATDPEPAVADAAEDPVPPAAEPAPPVAVEASLPLANYDQLSLASLRGRLRSLDVTQLRQLISYEQEHAARADVLAMFERRITKLETGA
jgi:hypothetical protein